MELICLKCRRLIEEQQCPFCGNTETREPERDDPCYLTELDDPMSAALSATFELNGIAHRIRIRHVGRTSIMRAFYVPYDQFDDAWSEVQKMWEDVRPTDPAHLEEADLFSGEEIDQMETVQLDQMSVEELRAYKNKITRTLKEIKAREQQWKQRTIVLLDMREEVECLIDDLS